MWVVALLQASDVTNNVRLLGCHLGFLPRIRNQVKTARKSFFFFAFFMINNTQISTLYDFSHNINFYC